jgi:hypothetical protein
MVVPLAMSVSGNDDYQRAHGRREIPLQGTDFFATLPAPGDTSGMIEEKEIGSTRSGCEP